MMSPSTHLAAVLLLLLGTQDGVKSHIYRGPRGGRSRFNAWPSAYLSNDMDTGAFRPFHAYPRGGGIFSTGSPLIDVFQEVVGDIKKAARELSDSYPGASPQTPPHEVLDTPDAVTVNVDLPGCKKHDVNAQISEDAGKKTLTITAVRKKARHGGGGHAGGHADTPADQTRASDVPSSGAAGDDESFNTPPPPPFTEEKYELSFRIGEGIDVSGVRGKFEDGVLTLVLPRTAPEPPAQPVEIPIDPPIGNENRQGASTGVGVGFSSSEGVSSEASANTHISLS